jgi:two-component system OmpR family response regulator
MFVYTGAATARYTIDLTSAMSTSPSVETIARTAQTAVSFAPHILVVDDDPDICRLISDCLAEFGLRVSCAGDGSSMRKELAQSVVDLIVLDLKLPAEDGMTLARELRAKSSTPIIMVTSRKDDVDRVMGLELGADDYLTKPFNPRELVARIRAVLRRTQLHPVPRAEGDPLQALRFGAWELNLRTRRLSSTDGDTVELTHAEFALLVAFLGAPQRILSREQLLELSRGHDDEVFDRSIDVQILRLRRKLETNPSRPELIKTERGAGYFFNASVEAIA